MKSLKFVLALIIPFALVSCQEKSDKMEDNSHKEGVVENNDVPAAVTAQFAKDHPDVKDVEWEQEGKDYFEANWMTGELEHGIVYDKEAKMVSFEDEFPVAELPENVSMYITEKYPDAEISKAEKETMGGKTVMEVGIKSGDKWMELQFDEEGNFAGMEDEDDDDDEEGDDD